MTNSEIVSRIATGINALNKDSRISKRYILHVARKKAESYISSKLNDRSLYRENNVFVSIPCFELQKEDVIKCNIVEFRRCKSLMKSKHKLPKLIYSKYGSSLKEVTSIDSLKEFSPTTPSQYKKNQNRVEKSDNIEYYVKDDYLYLVDSEIEGVDLYLITMETDKINTLSACNSEDCECKSLWEYEFTIPNKLEEQVVLDSIKEISLKLGIPTDETGNLNSNEK